MNRPLTLEDVNWGGGEETYTDDDGAPKGCVSAPKVFLV